MCTYRYAVEMKRLQIISLSFFFGIFIVPSWGLNTSIDECLNFYEKHQSNFEEIASYHHLDVCQVAAIALPEVSRFVGWQNQLESLALYQFYIDGGTEDADFSIGYFQMKPSFIEKIECEIVENSTLSQKYNELLPQGDWSEKERRIFRLQQLKNTNIQFEYLCVFYEIMENKTENVCFNLIENKIQFFAAAYNFGFDREIRKIKNWMHIKAFPYGSRFNFEQDAYSEVASYIFRNIKINSCMK